MTALAEFNLKRRLKSHVCCIVKLFAHHLPTVVDRAEEEFGTTIDDATSHPGLYRLFAENRVKKLKDLRPFCTLSQWDQLFTDGQAAGVTLEDFHQFAEEVGKRIEIVQEFSRKRQPQRKDSGESEDFS